MFTIRLTAAVILLSILSISDTPAYYDGNNEDLVIDAPWRTIRDYVPVLFYTPQFEDSGLVIKSISLYNFDRDSGEKQSIIFEDNVAGADRLTCGEGAQVNLIDGNGSPRSGHDANEDLGSHWHYIARVPISCIGTAELRGRPGEHFLYGRIVWFEPSGPDSSPVRRETYKVLRVLVSDGHFPTFSPIDRHYDIHVHTIAEQTDWDLIDLEVDASGYKFGGPLAMLMESAYALGLIEVQLNNGNWSDFKERVTTTDHNNFFSSDEYSDGAAPGRSNSGPIIDSRYGPTSITDGHVGEFNWYRENLGNLAGEEVALKGVGRYQQPVPFLRDACDEIEIPVEDCAPATKRLGSHFLAYGSPHFEGPWHGGEYKPIVKGQYVPGMEKGTENPLDIDFVMREMSKTNGFGYAAHPYNPGLGWSVDYFVRAIGLPPHNKGELGSPILQASGKDFVFKGSQVWNGKKDKYSNSIQEGGSLEDSDADRLNPFPVLGKESADKDRWMGQRFVANDTWDQFTFAARNEYISYLQRGLSYSFADAPSRKFVRKLYMSAGTDAHGDFNYLTGPVTAAADSEVKAFFGVDANNLILNNNAFGRVRTYTLTSERNIEPGQAVRSSRLTAGPRGPATPLDAAVNSISTNTNAPSPPLESVLAYREGNTILTDGPICTISADANCRFDSDPKSLRWHDQQCTWENYDGLIGGRGNFDGGGTMLAPQQDSEVRIKTKWDGRNDHYAENWEEPDSIDFEVQRIDTSSTAAFRKRFSSRRGQLFTGRYSPFRSDDNDWTPSATILTGSLGTGERKALCMTNPIWAAPYTIAVQKPASCPIKPNELEVTVSFGISMDTRDRPTGVTRPIWAGESSPNVPNLGARILIRPLDSRGRSIDNILELSEGRVWGPNQIGGPEPGVIQGAVLTAKNAKEIPCAESGWNAQTHRADSARSSYAVIVTDLHDMHQNRLNAIASTFTIENKSKAHRGDTVPTPMSPTDAGEPTNNDPGHGGIVRHYDDIPPTIRPQSSEDKAPLRIVDSSLLGQGVIRTSLGYSTTRNWSGKITVSIDPPFRMSRQVRADRSTVYIDGGRERTNGRATLTYEVDCNVSNEIAGRKLTARYTIHQKLPSKNVSRSSFGPAMAEETHSFSISAACAIKDRNRRDRTE